MFEKTCIAKGCTDYSCFGYGLPSWKIPMRFACAQHKNMLTPVPAVSTTAGMTAGGGGKKHKPPATPGFDLFGGV